MKKTLTVLLALIAALALTLGAAGCSGELGSATDPAEGSVATAATSATEPAPTAQSDTTATGSGDAHSESAEGKDETVATYPAALTLAYDDNDLDAAWDEFKASFITLADGAIRFDGAGAGTGATTEASKVTIRPPARMWSAARRATLRSWWTWRRPDSSGWS